MGETASVHFPDDEQDLYEWMERMWKDGEYANRSHVVRVALQRMKQQKGSEIVV